jgi:hypothetical protein
LHRMPVARGHLTFGPTPARGRIDSLLAQLLTSLRTPLRTLQKNKSPSGGFS